MRIKLETGFVEYELIRKLANNPLNAYVYLARLSTSNIPDFPKEFVIKRAHEVPESTPFNTGNRPQTFLAKEAELLKQLSHPHIIKQLGFVDDIIGKEILLEYLPEVFTDSTFRMSEQEVFVMIREITAGLMYMHEKGYAHLDVKPANLGKSECYKVFDLQISKKVGQGVTLLTEDSDSNYNGDRISETGEKTPKKKPLVIGTESYVAPEIKNEGYYSPAADAYAVGKCLDKLLFEKNKATYKFIRGYSRQDDLEEMFINRSSKRFNYTIDYFIKQLLNPDPILRLSVSTLHKCVKKLPDRYYRAEDTGQR